MISNKNRKEARAHCSCRVKLPRLNKEKKQWGLGLNKEGKERVVVRSLG